jgi:hypothetical protein
MSPYRFSPLALVIILSSTFCGASAQPAPQTASKPSESITVTAGKYPQSLIRGFVDSHIAPTHVAGKLARWKDPICPDVLGLPPKFAGFIRQRIVEVAGRVGAPANSRPRCRPNMHVVFTTTPQALMDTVRKKYPDVLGYYDSSAQADRMAQVTKLIQAWYVTASVDLRGNVYVDSRRPGSVELCMPNPMPTPGMPCIPMVMPNATIMNVTGSRLGDGVSGALVHVLVVANPDKLVTYEMGALGDYIAMLALSQQPRPDGCQALPSILNLLEPQCPQVGALSDADAAYLAALYRIGAGDSLQQQRDQLVSAINRSVGEP